MPKIWELQRLSPLQHRGERLLLDAGQTRQQVGRSRRCAIRLYSSSASREHAELVLSAEGEWLLSPSPGRTVLADGGPIEGACELCEGLQLAFGDDRFRVQTPHPDTAAVAEPVGWGFALSRGALLGILGLLVGCLLLLLIWRLTL
jgi:hypothetical protein